MKKYLILIVTIFVSCMMLNIGFARHEPPDKSFKHSSNIQLAADFFRFRPNRQKQFHQQQRYQQQQRRQVQQQRYNDHDYTDDGYSDYQQNDRRRYNNRYRTRYPNQYDDDNYNRERGYYRANYRDEYQGFQQQKHPQTPTVRYSEKLCDSGKYDCIKVKSGDKWSKLFPDEQQRDLVKRFNRTNIRLRVGSRVAIPPNLKSATLIDIAPFNKKIDNGGKKLILVNLPKLAYAAYDEDGNIVRWGPVSGGRDWCGDIGRPCNTIRGAFAVFNKDDARCRSNTFPANQNGGAPMPYCMFFHTGYALHGSNEVPGYNASHGCVRMYTEDAKWLNEHFVDLPLTVNDSGTDVIVLTDESRAEDLKPQVTEDEQSVEAEEAHYRRAPNVEQQNRQVDFEEAPR